MKNTILCQIGDFFCPHSCIKCGKSGGILCLCCKKNLLTQSWDRCLVCNAELVSNSCINCDLFNKQYCVGARTGVLKDLINVYKYDSARAASWIFTEMIEKKLYDSSGILVPLPTIGRHIRERGYDHIKLIVQHSALPYDVILRRNNNAVQVGATAEKRERQAKNTYKAKYQANPEVEYVLFDDVWTTGSSLLAARDVLLRAGAQKVSVMVLAKTIH